MLNDKEKAELLQRLINIELKVNAIAGYRPPSTGGSHSYAGHPDQAFGPTTFSQFGEDLIVANIFSLLGVSTPSYLDVGAHHPLHVSNTALLYSRGSRGINVEANPDLIDSFRELRPEDITLNIGVGPISGRLEFYRIDAFSGRNTFNKKVAEAFVLEHPQFAISDILQVDVLPLDEIVRIHNKGIYPQFLSIDVEGLDFEVLRAANFALSKPIVICVEAISGADSDDSLRLLNLLRKRDYELYTRTIGNLILVDAAHAQQLGLCA